MTRMRYKKKSDQAVIAIQLDLDTKGFRYQKWGAEQRCKQGDWLVNNSGDIYTVDQQVFTNTYNQISPGAYVKTTSVWAEVAEKEGRVKTKEGMSHYKPGDYLVFNNEDGTDAYCISAAKFEAMYELDEAG
jgi:hypothetical protein